MPTFWKDPVRVAELQKSLNIAVGGTTLTIDGVATLVVNDRVLLLGQTNRAENGIYLVQTGAWTRALDATTAADLDASATLFVTDGNTWKGVAFRQSVRSPASFNALRFARAEADYDVMEFGAKGDGITLPGCSVTSGSATLNCAAAAFSSADISKQVLVRIPSNPASGTVATTAQNSTLTGAGTSFTTQLATNQIIVIANGLTLTDHVVLAVIDNTHVTVAPTPEVSATGLTMYRTMSKHVTSVSASASATSLTLGASAPATSTIAVLEMGSDDRAAIQAAVDAASNAGGGVVTIPTGTFVLGSKLQLASNVSMVGIGRATSVLRATPNWTNIVGGGMIELRGVANVQMRDLTIDQAGHGHDFAGPFIDHALLCAAVQNCTFERVRFINAGVAATTNGTPSGPVLLFVAKDTANDIGGQFLTVPSLPCRGNVVRDCEFVQSGAVRIAKGLGMISDFGLLKPLPSDPAFDPTPQTTLASAIASGSATAQVTSAVGFSLGDQIRVAQSAIPVNFNLLRISNIRGTTIFFDSPTTLAFASGDPFSRVSVQTTVSGVETAPQTIISVANATGFKEKDFIRIESASNPAIFDSARITNITGSNITISAPTTNSYTAGDKFGLAKGYSPFGDEFGNNVSSLRSRQVDPNGDAFVNHIEGNLIGGCVFRGLFGLYAIGVQGGGTRQNTISDCRFEATIGLNAVLIDKGAYSNQVIDCSATSQRRDGLLDAGPNGEFTDNPMAVFACRSYPFYYDTENSFDRCKVISASATTLAPGFIYDAGFAIGEYAVRGALRNCSVSGIISTKGSCGILIGRGNIDYRITDCTITNADYGVYTYLGGPATVHGSGGRIDGCAIDVAKNGIVVNSAPSGKIRGTMIVTSNRIRQSDVVADGVLSIGDNVDAAQVHDNYIENTRIPAGAGHVAMDLLCRTGSADGNHVKNSNIAYRIGAGFAGHWGLRNHADQSSVNISVNPSATFPVPAGSGLGGLTIASNYNIVLGGTGDVKHGDRTLVLGAALGAADSSSWGLFLSQGGSPIPSAWTATAASTIVGFSLPLRIGDRIKEVLFRVRDTAGGSTLTMRVCKNTSAGTTNIGSPAVSAGNGTYQTFAITGLAATIVSGEFYNAIVLKNGGATATHMVLGVEVTYDRP